MRLSDSSPLENLRRLYGPEAVAVNRIANDVAFAYRLEGVDHGDGRYGVSELTGRLEAAVNGRVVYEGTRPIVYGDEVVLLAAYRRQTDIDRFLAGSSA